MRNWRTKKNWIQAAALCIGMAIAAGASARADVTSELSAVKVAMGADGNEAFAPAPSVRPGELIEYRVDYRNKGDESARALEVTLPIPVGLEYLPSSAQPAGARASLDGKSYQAMPLKRMVKGADGKEIEQLIAVAEYRFLRWSASDLGAGKTARYTARMRVSSGNVVLPAAASGATAK